MRKAKIILSLMLSGVLTTGLIVSAADNEVNNIENENIATSTATSTVNNECDHGLTNSKIIQPTCTEGGEKIEDCIYCGEIVKVTPLKPLGHNVNYNKYEVVKQPTETEYGEIVYRCERCGEIIDHGLLPKIDPTKPTNPDEDVVILPSEDEDNNSDNNNDNEDKPSTATPTNPSTVTPEEPKEDEPSAPTVVKRLKIIDKDATCTENGEWHYEVIMSDGTKEDLRNSIEFNYCIYHTLISGIAIEGHSIVIEPNKLGYFNSKEMAERFVEENKEDLITYFEIEMKLSK